MSIFLGGLLSFKKCFTKNNYNKENEDHIIIISGYAVYSTIRLKTAILIWNHVTTVLKKNIMATDVQNVIFFTPTGVLLGTQRSQSHAVVIAENLFTTGAI